MAIASRLQEIKKTTRIGSLQTQQIRKNYNRPKTTVLLKPKPRTEPTLNDKKRKLKLTSNLKLHDPTLSTVRSIL
jgi:hypothetical protein